MLNNVSLTLMRAGFIFWNIPKNTKKKETVVCYKMKMMINLTSDWKKYKKECIQSHMTLLIEKEKKKKRKEKEYSFYES